MKIRTKPTGEQYWAYVVCYVDDILCIDHDPTVPMNMLGNIYRMKEGSVGKPTMYLGANIREWTVQDADGAETNCFAMGSHGHVKEAIRIVESLMTQHNLSYSSSRHQGRDALFSSSAYRPELDSSPYLDDDLVTVYQNLMGILQWLCKLGRVDIIHEATVLSQYMVQPRIGHLSQALNIFKYLKLSPIKGWMVFDAYDFDIEWIPFCADESPLMEQAEAMSRLYPDSFDELPPGMPPALGMEVNIN